jgi:hypothetical protein
LSQQAGYVYGLRHLRREVPRICVVGAFDHAAIGCLTRASGSAKPHPPARQHERSLAAHHWRQGRSPEQFFMTL